MEKDEMSDNAFNKILELLAQKIEQNAKTGEEAAQMIRDAQIK